MSTIQTPHIYKNVKLEIDLETYKVTDLEGKVRTARRKLGFTEITTDDNKVIEYLDPETITFLGRRYKKPTQNPTHIDLYLPVLPYEY